MVTNWVSASVSHVLLVLQYSTLTDLSRWPNWYIQLGCGITVDIIMLCRCQCTAILSTSLMGTTPYVACLLTYFYKCKLSNLAYAIFVAFGWHFSCGQIVQWQWLINVAVN